MSSDGPSCWEENSPDSLLAIAAKFLVHRPELYCQEWYEVDEGEEVARVAVRLLPDLMLPAELSERLLRTIHEEGLDVTDAAAAPFAPDGGRCGRLREVSVRDSSVTAEGLAALLAHQPAALDVHNCQNLEPFSLELVNRHSDSLTSLNLGNTVHILPDYVLDGKDDDDVNNEGEPEDSLDEDVASARVFSERGYILRGPRLQRLSMRDLLVREGRAYMNLLLRPLTSLTHLDVSGLGCAEGHDLGGFSWLLHLPKLSSLVLHNVVGIDAGVPVICSIKTLQHLDVSHSDDKIGYFTEPNRVLAEIAGSLPALTSLDIGGTNLAGTGAFEGPSTAATPMAHCDIPGLACRADRPLEFLGLYKTTHDACLRAHLPAAAVAGSANEEQILVAARQYLDRPGMLEMVLNDLFHLFRYETCNNLKRALDLILLAMDRHPAEKIIQISGSASLYYVVKSEIRQSINVKMKKKILSTLLNGMFAHKSDSVMMRNGCLTLCQFSIPSDVVSSPVLADSQGS